MNPLIPQTRSNDEPAWQTYLRAFLFLLPASVAWLFSYILILPTLEEIWGKAGMTNPGPKWLIDGSDFFVLYGRLVIPAVFLFFMALEFLLPTWSRYRRFVIPFVTFVLNTAVFVGMATLCTLATLAAKVLVKAQ
jgi:type II secretory pathway component PulF